MEIGSVAYSEVHGWRGVLVNVKNIGRLAALLIHSVWVPILHIVALARSFAHSQGHRRL